jgi:hypothetical protein
MFPWHRQSLDKYGFSVSWGPSQRQNLHVNTDCGDYGRLRCRSCLLPMDRYQFEDVVGDLGLAVGRLYLGDEVLPKNDAIIVTHAPT